MELEFLINEEVENNPGKYREETVGRVLEFARASLEQDRKYAPYGLLKTIEDLELYYNSNPELRGKNTNELQKGKKEYRTFYSLVLRRAKEQSKGNRALQKKLIQKVFSVLMAPRLLYTTEKEWIKHRDLHPDWQNKTTSEMINDREKGETELYNFYMSCLIWAVEKSKGNKKTQYALIRKVFPNIRDSKALYTLEDWKEKKKEIREWDGKSPTEIRNDSKNKGRTFYYSFNKWANDNAKGDRKYKKFLVNELYEK